MRDLVTCDGLWQLVEPSAARVAVLILLHGQRQIQFVTYGKDATDKSEAHNLKEWVKGEVFQGEVPQATTYESFILEAARNREELDGLLRRLTALAAVDRVVAEQLQALGEHHWLAGNANTAQNLDRLTLMLRQAVDQAEEVAP